jgi:hypothetical protein
MRILTILVGLVVGALVLSTPAFAGKPVCGDGKCQGNETPETCSADCAATGPECGNGICEEGEDPLLCPPDCGGAELDHWAEVVGDPGSSMGQFGIAAGYFNDDPFLDIAAGGPTFDNGRVGAAGKLYVFMYNDGNGPFGTSEDDWAKVGPSKVAQLGYSVANAGNFDGEGGDDIVVSAPSFSLGNRPSEKKIGKVYVFSGDGNKLFERNGIQGYEWFGWSVSGAGNIDDDGFDDIVAGARFYDDDRGRVAIYSIGGEDNPLFGRTGYAEGDHFGCSVSGGKDIDNDGLPELLVGADDAEGGLGAAYLYLGTDFQDTDLGGFPQLALKFIGEDGRFGYRVALLGDVDGDGHGDVVIGAPSYENGADKGAVYVYSGNPLDADENGSPRELFRVYGTEGLGDWVADAGVVDGVHGSDVLVSAKSFNGRGKIFIYGCVGYDPNPPCSDIKLLYSREGIGSDAFGSTVLGGVDWPNYPEGPDILVGEPYFGDAAGKVYVFQPEEETPPEN